MISEIEWQAMRAEAHRKERAVLMTALLPVVALLVSALGGIALFVFH